MNGGMAEREADGFLGVALDRGRGTAAVGEAESPAITYVEEVSSGRTYAVSPEVLTELGYAQEEWMGDADLWIHCIHAEDRDRVVASCELANQTGEPYIEEYRLWTKDGHLVWIRDEALIVRDSHGEPLCWQGVMRVLGPAE